MTKKKVYWYGIRTVSYDLKISQAEVIKETPKRICFQPDNEAVFRRASVAKFSNYERWYPTREEAVAAKLTSLKRTVKSSTENVREAKKRLKEFKEQEGLE